jgi:hypothetical protein
MARHLNSLFTELLPELTLLGRLLVLVHRPSILITLDTSLCTLPTKATAAPRPLDHRPLTLAPARPQTRLTPARSGRSNKPIGVDEDDADAFVDDFLSACQPPLFPLERLSEFTLHLFSAVSERSAEIFSDYIIVVVQHILSHLSTLPHRLAARPAEGRTTALYPRTFGGRPRLWPPLTADAAPPARFTVTF